MSRDERMIELLQSASNAPSVMELLTRSQQPGPLVQELCPITESIAWRRSQRYWARSGIDVFTSGEVPYVATNDGEQSRKAVNVYLASLLASEQSGSRETLSYVLELGPGSGVFAKLFLDQLRASAPDDYARTNYLLCDCSQALLEGTRRSGLFAEHEDRVFRLQLRSHDLRLELSRLLPDTIGHVRVVHANYLFDSLPFTIVSMHDGQLFELRIRTHLNSEIARLAKTPPPLEDPTALDAWLDELGTAGPIASQQALTYSAEYVSTDRAQLPYGELLDLSASDGPSQQIMHSFGALACVDKLMGLLRADGYVCCMDYGYEGGSPEPLDFQCFGSSISAAVNFAQLAQLARSRRGWAAVNPDGDPPNLKCRMLACEAVSEPVLERFRSVYGKLAWESADAPYADAMRLSKSGQFEAARWRFVEAHRLQPYNWHLMESMVAFLSYTLGEHASGLELAKRALELNPLSPRLWNLLGDCHYALEELSSAECAYEQAVRVCGTDVRAHANLAYVYLKRGAFRPALRMIGEALALDSSGEQREELLAKQSEVLAAMAQTRARYAWRSVNRLRGHHALPGRTHQ